MPRGVFGNVAHNKFRARKFAVCLPWTRRVVRDGALTLRCPTDPHPRAGPHQGAPIRRMPTRWTAPWATACPAALNSPSPTGGPLRASRPALAPNMPRLRPPRLPGPCNARRNPTQPRAPPSVPQFCVCLGALCVPPGAWRGACAPWERYAVRVVSPGTYHSPALHRRCVGPARAEGGRWLGASRIALVAACPRPPLGRRPQSPAHSWRAAVWREWRGAAALPRRWACRRGGSGGNASVCGLHAGACRAARRCV